jgi:tetratricopeptide (TPR) repeat protein
MLLKGRCFWNKSGTEKQKKAMQYEQQAIAIDPAYAPAYAALPSSYNQLLAVGVLDPKVYIHKAEAPARKALELDKSLAEGRFALAAIKITIWDWAAAERQCGRAIHPRAAERQ